MKQGTSNGIGKIDIDEVGNKYITCYNGICIFNESGITSVNQNSNILKTFKLHQNYPNPFNPSTMIKYKLPKSSHIKLKVYNLAGQEIATLINKFQLAGEHEVTWQPKGLPSGLYFYKIQAREYSEAKKLILQK